MGSTAPELTSTRKHVCEYVVSGANVAQRSFVGVAVLGA